MAIKSVKLFAGKEIRRFSLESTDGNFKFEKMIEKVVQLYPQLPLVKLAWKDEDGDFVAITNDDDVKEAVRQTNNDTLRIYLTSPADIVELSRENLSVKGDNENAAQEEQISEETEVSVEENHATKLEEQDPSLHKGVRCDGCSGPVKGLRYKCLTCPDYDLCECCESNHIHNDHPMIRIVSPKDNLWRKAFFASQFEMNPHPFHPRSFHCRSGWRRGPHVERCGGERNCHSPTGGESQQEKGKESDRNLQIKEKQSEIPIFGEIVTSVLEAVDAVAKQVELAEQDHKPTLHFGIFCDGCNEPVEGVRFKCLTCPDFDLCSLCETKLGHDHPMIRISSPNNKSWRKAHFNRHLLRHPHPKPCHQFSCHPRLPHLHQVPLQYVRWGPHGRRCGCGHRCQPSNGECYQQQERRKIEENVEKASQQNFPDFGEVITAVLDAVGMDLVKVISLFENDQSLLENTPAKKEETSDLQNVETKPTTTISTDSTSKPNATKSIDPMEKIQEAFDQLLSAGIVKDDTGFLRDMLAQSKGYIASVVDLVKQQQQQKN